MPSLVPSGRRNNGGDGEAGRSRHRSSRRDLVPATYAVAPRVRRLVVPFIASRFSIPEAVDAIPSFREGGLEVGGDVLHQP